MEQDNQNTTDADSQMNELIAPNSAPQSETIVTGETVKKHRNNKWIFPVLIVVLLCAIGGGSWFLFMREKPTDNIDAQNVNTITNYDECVKAGYPVMESSPEQCSVPGGQTFTNATAVDDSSNTAEAKDSGPKCASTETLFADKEFGAAFCYPTDWGTASVMDAKIDTTDTGYREAVRFSANTKFIVGGVSEDWTTTVGRGVACQEPNNSVPGPDSFDTEWHDITGEGMNVEFATRSLTPAIVTGSSYDLVETVSNLLDSGVCAQGHAVINGSRYLLLSAAYYMDFSDSLGITTPKAHMDNPNVLFTVEERAQFDALLASAVSY